MSYKQFIIFCFQNYPSVFPILVRSTPTHLKTSNWFWRPYILSSKFVLSFPSSQNQKFKPKSSLPWISVLWKSLSGSNVQDRQIECVKAGTKITANSMLFSLLKSCGWLHINYRVKCNLSWQEAFQNQVLPTSPLSCLLQTIESKFLNSPALEGVLM